MTTIEERADTITRGIWDARSSTGMDTYSALRDIVFKELAADEVRQASKREVDGAKGYPAEYGRQRDIAIKKATAPHPWGDVPPSLEEIAREMGVKIETLTDGTVRASLHVCPCVDCRNERYEMAPGWRTAHDQ